MQQTLTARLQNDKLFQPGVWAENACNSCPRRKVCPAGELDISDLHEFSTHVNHQRSVRTGQLILAAGEPFPGIYIVRSGFFKSYLINRDGELQVTGFHLPGEVFGLEGISDGAYKYSVEALDTGSVCRIPASLFSRNSVQGQAIVHVLLGVMSRIIIRDNELIFSLVKLSAPRRLTTFLIDLSRIRD
jgi:CRP/FNR family transcriptional regulator, anaerobic regulatory protein